MLVYLSSQLVGTFQNKKTSSQNGEMFLQLLRSFTHSNAAQKGCLQSASWKHFKLATACRGAGWQQAAHWSKRAQSVTVRLSTKYLILLFASAFVVWAVVHKEAATLVATCDSGRRRSRHCCSQTSCMLSSSKQRRSDEQRKVSLQQGRKRVSKVREGN